MKNFKRFLENSSVEIRYIATVALVCLGLAFVLDARTPRTDGVITVEFSDQANADMQTNFMGGLTNVVLSASDTNVAARVDAASTAVTGGLTTANTNIATHVDSASTAITGGLTTANTNIATHVDSASSAIVSKLDDVTITALPDSSSGPVTFTTTGSLTSNNIYSTAKIVHGWACFTTNASVIVINLYDKASAPTTNDVAKLRIVMNGPGGNNYYTAGGWAFTNGVSYSISTSLETNWYTAPAGSVVGNFDIE